MDLTDLSTLGYTTAPDRGHECPGRDRGINNDFRVIFEMYGRFAIQIWFDFQYLWNTKWDSMWVIYLLFGVDAKSKLQSPLLRKWSIAYDMNDGMRLTFVLSD